MVLTALTCLQISKYEDLMVSGWFDGGENISAQETCDFGETNLGVSGNCVLPWL